MSEIALSRVEAWGEAKGIPALALAEQDYRLTDVLARICTDEVLRTRLAFKGGTAINKLHLGTSGRLSVDLDFNLLGTRDSVQGARGEIRARVVKALREHDDTMTISHDHAWESLRATGNYRPLSGENPMKMKVEVSMVERLPIAGTLERPLATVGGGTVDVPTYTLEELLSTKFRALYRRKKGRDLYDMDQSLPLIRNPVLMRRMAVFHFYRAGILFQAREVADNIRAKLRDERFVGESALYLRGGVEWDGHLAADRFFERYAFLFETSPAEEEFLRIAGRLLGKDGTPVERAPETGDRPLSRLFAGCAGVTPEALGVGLDEIKVRTRR